MESLNKETKSESISEKIHDEIWKAEGETALLHNEIGYYMGRSNALSLTYDRFANVNYQALKYAHQNWRFLRGLMKDGLEFYTTAGK